MAYKNWNWLHKDWPQFSYDKKILEKLELQFSQNAGIVIGAVKHINATSKDDLLIITASS